jgi:hypothetical protein
MAASTRAKIIVGVDYGTTYTVRDSVSQSAWKKLLNVL